MLDSVDAHTAFDRPDLSGFLMAPGLDVVVRGIQDEAQCATLSVEGRKPKPSRVIRLDVDRIAMVDPACLTPEMA